MDRQEIAIQLASGGLRDDGVYLLTELVDNHSYQGHCVVNGNFYITFRSYIENV